MSRQYNASDYIDVASRIVEFRTKYPEGSLQPADPQVPYRIENIAGDTYIVVVAAAFRSPDDPRPGMGMAYEVYPGRTNFTKGSELQNAETSAWGRAIVAALAADTKQGVASQEEVRNRSAERDPLGLARDAVWKEAQRLGLDMPALREEYARATGGQLLDDAPVNDLKKFADVLRSTGTNGLPLNKDGSVSKRQTSEEERVQVGMASDEQAKDHKQLVAEVFADDKKAERLHGLQPDDPWADVEVAKPGSAA